MLKNPFILSANPSPEHTYKNALQRLDDEGKSFTCVVRLQETRDKDEENKGAKRGTFVVRSKQTRDKDDGNKE